MNSSLYYRPTNPNPCFECKVRSLGCHSHCKPYSAWKECIAADKRKRDKILDSEIKNKSCYECKGEKNGQTKKSQQCRKQRSGC